MVFIFKSERVNKWEIPNFYATGISKVIYLHVKHIMEDWLLKTFKRKKEKVKMKFRVRILFTGAFADLNSYLFLFSYEWNEKTVFLFVC